MEDIDTIMRANQVRFVVRSIADPAGVGDIPREREGRDWRNRGIRWLQGKDGYTSVAYRMLASLDLEEYEGLWVVHALRWRIKGGWYGKGCMGFFPRLEGSHLCSQESREDGESQSRRSGAADGGGRQEGG